MEQHGAKVRAPRRGCSTGRSLRSRFAEGGKRGAVSGVRRSRGFQLCFNSLSNTRRAARQSAVEIAGRGEQMPGIMTFQMDVSAG